MASLSLPHCLVRCSDNPIMVWPEDAPVPTMRIETVEVGAFHTSQLGGALQSRKQRSVAAAAQRSKAESGVTTSQERYLLLQFGREPNPMGAQVGQAACGPAPFSIRVRCQASVLSPFDHFCVR
jgi:hypothetical protein